MYHIFFQQLFFKKFLREILLTLDVGVVVSEIVWSCMARLYSSLTKANSGKDVIVDTMIA